jgi:hypothetical protein
VADFDDFADFFFLGVFLQLLMASLVAIELEVGGLAKLHHVLLAHLAGHEILK